MTIRALILIVLVLLFHWIVDFCMQSDSTAKNKSHDYTVLFGHSLSYAALITSAIILSVQSLTPIQAMYVLILLLISHFAIDGISSRISRIFFLENDMHSFFVTIGFDQFLHTAILVFILYSFLKDKV